MIEVLKEFSDNVAAYACHGRLTKADYETVLIPHIEEKLNRHKKLRSYCEVAPDYVGVDPGAVREDWKVASVTWFDWERAAIVTDVEWMSGRRGFSVSCFLGSGMYFRSLKPTRRASGLLAGVPPRGCSVSCLRACRTVQRSDRSGTHTSRRRRVLAHLPARSRSPEVGAGEELKPVCAEVPNGPHAATYFGWWPTYSIRLTGVDPFLRGCLRNTRHGKDLWHL